MIGFFRKGFTMKKGFVLAVIVALLVMFSITSAQDNESLIDFDSTLTISDAGIILPVNSDWVNTQSNGLHLAANQDDLDAVTDDSARTMAEDVTVYFLLFEKSEIEADERTSVDDIADTVLSVLAEDAEEQERFSFGVLSRRAVVSVVGNSDDTAAFYAVWTQDENVVLLRLTAPDIDTLGEYGFTFGMMLGGISAMDAEDLERRPSEITGFDTPTVIRIPDGWSINDRDEILAVYEFESDIDIIVDESNEPLEGSAFSAVVTSPDEFNISERDDLADIIGAIEDANIIEEFTVEGEYNVGGFSGLGISGEFPNGRGVFIVFAFDFDNDAAYVYIFSSTSSRALRNMMPTFLMMLKSVQVEA
jgi:hypothetical protein